MIRPAVRWPPETSLCCPYRRRPDARETETATRKEVTVAVSGQGRGLLGRQLAAKPRLRRIRRATRPHTASRSSTTISEAIAERSTVRPSAPCSARSRTPMAACRGPGGALRRAAWQKLNDNRRRGPSVGSQPVPSERPGTQARDARSGRGASLDRSCGGAGSAGRSGSAGALPLNVQSRSPAVADIMGARRMCTGGDDLLRVDAMEVHRGRAEIGVAELPLDDVQRYALAGEFEFKRVRVAQLMRRDAAPDPGASGEPGGTRSGPRRSTTVARGSGRRCAEQRPHRHL